MEAVDLVCFKCKNYRKFSGCCLAFPEGIPDQITSGQKEHSKPLKGQRNKIVFEPIKEGDCELVNSLN